MRSRLHRLRATPARRELFADVRPEPRGLCLPVFAHLEREPEPIASLPGVSRMPIADLAPLAKRVVAAGIRSVLVFGVPASKGLAASTDADGPAARAIAEIKDATGDDLVVVADTCLCSYSEDGHCCIYSSDGSIDLPSTHRALAAAAISQAAAGADMVGPSDMMDGHVAAIRDALDDAGHHMTGIVSYAAKFASSLYGPFRDAAASTPSHGDRRGYQIDPAGGRQAIASIRRDLSEGADAAIVKPAMPCLDIISEARSSFEAPIWAYQVSGEYAMLRSGVVDERLAILESLTAIRRAGADVTITYAALEAARWLADS